MFTVWRLRRARKKVDADFSRELTKLRKAKASLEQIGKLEFEHSTRAEEYDDDIAIALSARLLDEAYNKYDVEVPEFSDKSIWTGQEIGPHEFRHWLSSRGRSHVRKLIDEEKARRFEVRTRWVTRLILPLLAALVGVIGALTGLIAVLRHKP